jgi:succinate-semialdehyde dehydrogenase/glutarate-semialdehyde dehydrogenase
MNGRIFEAGVLQHVAPGMPAFEEETFGPIAAFTAYDSTEDAVRLHESSRFGLGLSIFTSKPEEWSKEARMFSDGAVFFNEMVKSDPRLPFGGQKSSGYGRELAKDGLMEFINRKLIYTA